MRPELALLTIAAAGLPTVAVARLPSITYVTSDPVVVRFPFQTVSAPTNDVLQYGEDGDYLEIDEVWIKSTDGGRTEGACRKSGRSINYTPRDGYTGMALCQYTSRVVRPHGFPQYPEFTTTK